MIEVVLNDPLGKKVRVKCDEDVTIGDLKKLVAAQTGTRPTRSGSRSGTTPTRNISPSRTTRFTTAWASSSTTTSQPPADGGLLSDLFSYFFSFLLVL